MKDTGILLTSLETWDAVFSPSNMPGSSRPVCLCLSCQPGKHIFVLSKCCVKPTFFMKVFFNSIPRYNVSIPSSGPSICCANSIIITYLLWMIQSPPQESISSLKTRTVFYSPVDNHRSWFFGCHDHFIVYMEWQMATGHLPKWSHCNLSKGERASQRTEHQGVLPPFLCSKHSD